MKLIQIGKLQPEENLPVFVIIKSPTAGIYKARATLVEHEGEKVWKSLGDYEFEYKRQFLPFHYVDNWLEIPGFPSKHFPPLEEEVKPKRR